MKAAVLIKRLLGLSVVTRSRIGFMIALVAILSIAGKELIVNIDLFSGNDTFICLGLALLGTLGWVMGQVGQAKRAEPAPNPDAPDGEAAVEHPLAFLGSLKYWGLILVFTAGTLSCLISWRRHKPALVVRARQAPVKTAVTVTNIVTVTVTNQAPRPSFPRMELQGVVVNGAKSAALINGRVICLGEGISNAVLVSVDSEHACMALEGQTNVLALHK